MLTNHSLDPRRIRSGAVQLNVPFARWTSHESCPKSSNLRSTSFDPVVAHCWHKDCAGFFDVAWRLMLNADQGTDESVRRSGVSRRRG